MGNSSNLLGGFLAFEDTLKKGTFSAKENEAIALAVSQVNGCAYCLSAHTAIGKMNGFSEEETLALRDGTIADNKLNALVNLSREITENRGKTSKEAVENFSAAGYDLAAFAELIGMVAIRSITNYIFSNGDFEIDFPEAKSIDELIGA